VIVNEIKIPFYIFYTLLFLGQEPGQAGTEGNTWDEASGTPEAGPAADKADKAA
jgi:hypothetical protein